jgi:hypothetical protein
MRPLIYLLIPLLIAACTVVKNPSPVGRGYSSYAEPYKSAPGPKAPDIGYEYTAESNAEVTGIWLASVQDLLTRLETEAGLTEGSVFVVSSEQRGAMYTTFDHVLREELTARGYTLDANPAARRIGYDIERPKGRFLTNEETADEKGYEKLHYQDFILKLWVDEETKAVADTYYLPAAGSNSLKSKVDIKATREKEYNQ